MREIESEIEREIEREIASGTDAVGGSSISRGSIPSSGGSIASGGGHHEAPSALPLRPAEECRFFLIRRHAPFFPICRTPFPPYVRN